MDKTVRREIMRNHLIFTNDQTNNAKCAFKALKATEAIFTWSRTSFAPFVIRLSKKKEMKKKQKNGMHPFIFFIPRRIVSPAESCPTKG
jgi:hypothetical protein